MIAVYPDHTHLLCLTSPPELQLNKAYTSDTEAAFLDLRLSIPNDIVSTKIYDNMTEPDFYGDLVYKLKKIVGSHNFSAQFIKIISDYKKIGYNINVLQQTATWWSTLSRSATLLSSLIARRWVGLQTLGWFRLKYLSVDEMVGVLCFGCLSGSRGFTCWISFALVFSFIFC